MPSPNNDLSLFLEKYDLQISVITFPFDQLERAAECGDNLMSDDRGQSQGRGQVLKNNFIRKIKLTFVAVEMPVTQHPPHRSQRVDLPHWAPTSGSDAQALFGIRMIDKVLVYNRSANTVNTFVTNRT